MIAAFTLGSTFPASHTSGIWRYLWDPPVGGCEFFLHSKQNIQNLWWTKTNQQMLDDACRNVQMRPEASVFKSGNAPDCFSAFSEVFTRTIFRKPCWNFNSSKNWKNWDHVWRMLKEKIQRSQLITNDEHDKLTQVAKGLLSDWRCMTLGHSWGDRPGLRKHQQSTSILIWGWDSPTDGFPIFELIKQTSCPCFFLGQAKYTNRIK